MGEPTLGCVLWGLVVAYRLGEVAWARSNTRALVADGGVLHRDGTWLLVALHVATFAGIAIERLHGARLGGAVSWIAGAAFVLASFGRFWVLRSLGRRWTIRVVTVPGESRVLRGPYRFVRHPNYVVVMLEMIALPALFHAWWTLAIGTVPHALALVLRIRWEDAAWRESVLRSAARP
jgi:methyltransferase